MVAFIPRRPGSLRAADFIPAVGRRSGAALGRRRVVGFSSFFGFLLCLVLVFVDLFFLLSLVDLFLFFL